jgi:hypothetical protein
MDVRGRARTKDAGRCPGLVHLLAKEVRVQWSLAIRSVLERLVPVGGKAVSGRKGLWKSSLWGHSRSRKHTDVMSAYEPMDALGAADLM